MKVAGSTREGLVAMEDPKPNDKVLSRNFLLAMVREKFATEKCCLICLKVVEPHNRKQHKQTDAHKFLVCCLKREIYPYPCINCGMRFSTESDLLHHSFEHIGKLVIYEENQIFSPVCCYLCRVPFLSKEELNTHCSISVEHHWRRQTILEVACREYLAQDILNFINVPKVAPEEYISTSSGAVSDIQKDSNTNLVCTPANPAGQDRLEESLVQEDPKNDLLLTPEDSIPTSTGATSSVQVGLKTNLVLSPTNQSVGLEESLVQEDPKTDLLLTPEESVPTSRGAISSIQEGPKTNLVLSPTNHSIKIVDSETYCSVCSVRVPKTNMKEHLKGKTHCKNYEALLATDRKSSLPTVSGKILSSDKEKSSEVPIYSLNKSPEISQKSEMLFASKDTVQIGDSTLTCLQEEFEKLKISAEQDLNDYQVECETCGGVFQTFNNDVDLSFDLHVQNDPQHALAMAIPLDRDAKQMAELVKTSLAPKKQKQSSQKAVGAKIYQADGNGPSYCTICFQDISSLTSQARTQHLELCNSKSSAHLTTGTLITQETKLKTETVRDTSKVEQPPAPSKPNNEVNPNSLKFFCKVCYRLMTQGNKSSHLNSKGHKAKASTNFFCTICSKNMTTGEKENHFNSQAHKDRAALDFFCEICDKKMKQADKISHENSKLHKSKASLNFSCTVCAETMAEGEKENHLISKKHRQKAALDFFCEICQKWMMEANKSTHFKGKSHKSKASLDFSCTVCAETMAEGEKENHLISEKHRQNAALDLFCEICEKWMMEANKSIHLNSREHKARTRFYCELCNRTMQQHDKHSHLMGQQHKEKASCHSL